MVDTELLLGLVCEFGGGSCRGAGSLLVLLIGFIGDVLLTELALGDLKGQGRGAFRLSECEHDGLEVRVLREKVLHVLGEDVQMTAPSVGHTAVEPKVELP